jgi:DNA-binding NarL/FixJ family response regulator
MRPPRIVLASLDESVRDRVSIAAGRVPVDTTVTLEVAPGHSRGTLWFVDTALPDLPGWTAPAWSTLAGHGNFVVLSGVPTDEEGLAALEAGASGYCHAFASSEILGRVIDVVSDDGLWVGRSLMTRVLRGLQRGLAGSPVAHRWDRTLTPREREVAGRAASGDSNLAIAEALGITERTVKAHLTTIFEKLGVTDRLQLALRAHGVK